MATKRPTLRNVLELSGNTKLKDLPIIVNYLNLSSVVPVKLNRTAAQHLELLMTYEPQILDKTLTELTKYSGCDSDKHGNTYNCKSVLMWVTLAIMSLSYATVILYISLRNLVMPDWEDMVIPFIGPVLIVLHERGIVAKEGRDLLKALAGQAPAATIMEAVSKRIVNGPVNKKAQYKPNSSSKIHREVTEITDEVPVSKTDY